MPDKHEGVSAVLDLAADLMETHGWIKGDYFEHPNPDQMTVITEANEYIGGAMCTEGAIRAAASLIYDSTHETLGQLMMPRPVVHDALTAVREQLPDEYLRQFESDVIDTGVPVNPLRVSVPWWNDRHCATKEDAIAVLRDAATKTRPDMT